MNRNKRIKDVKTCMLKKDYKGVKHEQEQNNQRCKNRNVKTKTTRE